MTIAAIHAGLAYHTRTLEEGPFAPHFGPLFDVRDLGSADLSGLPVLMIPCRTPGHRLADHAARFQAYIEQGGFLVVMGETLPHLFLSGVEFTPEPTNYWWWLNPTADLGVSIALPDHPLMTGLSEADVSWHVHGTLAIPRGGRSLIDWRPDVVTKPASLMIEYELGRGRVLATTLDPIYHHGSGFMPATTRFLRAFLPALRAQTNSMINS